MKDTAKRVKRITEYAETVLKTETINLRLLPADAEASWEKSKQGAVVYIDDRSAAFVSGTTVEPWSSLERYADPIEKIILQKLYRSTLPFGRQDVLTSIAMVWGMFGDWVKHGEAKTLIKGVSLTKGVRFETVKECECSRFCTCPKNEPHTLLRWLETFAKSVGESWRTERRNRDQTLDNERAEARKKGLPVPEKPAQTDVWHLDYARPSGNPDMSSTSVLLGMSEYNDPPELDEYWDEAKINCDTVYGQKEKDDPHGEPASEHNDFSSSTRKSPGSAVKSQKFTGRPEGKDQRGLSANIGARFMHNRLECPNAEVEAALDPWKFTIDCGPRSLGFIVHKLNDQETSSIGVAQRWCAARPGVFPASHFRDCPHRHDMRPVTSNVVTDEEWKRGINAVPYFQEDGQEIPEEDQFRESDTLAGYATEHFQETGDFILGDMLPEVEEPDQLGVLRRAEDKRWYHREFGRVKLLEWRGKKEARVLVKREEVIVLKSDLRKEPWTKQTKTRKPTTQTGYRVHRGARVESKRIDSAIATDALTYCSTCSAPVVDSLQGIAAHVERMPQCKRAA